MGLAANLKLLEWFLLLVFFFFSLFFQFSVGMYDYSWSLEVWGLPIGRVGESWQTTLPDHMSVLEWRIFIVMHAWLCIHSWFYLSENLRALVSLNFYGVVSRNHASIDASKIDLCEFLVCAYVPYMIWCLGMNTLLQSHSLVSLLVLAVSQDLLMHISNLALQL